VLHEHSVCQHRSRGAKLGFPDRNEAPYRGLEINVYRNGVVVGKGPRALADVVDNTRIVDVKSARGEPVDLERAAAAVVAE
jgi:hypothetical protein